LGGKKQITFSRVENGPAISLQLSLRCESSLAMLPAFAHFNSVNSKNSLHPREYR
jgi:hypothetical protein